MEKNQEAVEQEVLAIIQAGFENDQQQQDDTATEPQTEQHTIDVDLYRLKNGGVLLIPSGSAAPPVDERAVEGSVTNTPPFDTTSTDEQAQEQEHAGQGLTEQTPTIPVALIAEPEPVGKRKTFVYRMAFVLLLAFLGAGAASYLYVLPVFASATVTIIPDVKSIHTGLSLTIAPVPHTGQIEGRQLQSITLTSSKTVAATGHTHEDATSAEGVITFYNSDSNPITIPTGVSFAIDGLTIVTDTTVTVQAAVPPVFGEGIVPAHAVQAGAIGNIPAHHIYTKCCGSQFVTATNVQAFTDGQDARDISFIQTSDIRNASQDLLAHVTPQVTRALTRQLRQGEQLVTPYCTPYTTSSQDPGAEATSVTVSVTQTCTSIAYSVDSLKTVAMSLLVHSENLTAYQQSGTVQVFVNGSTYEHGTARLIVLVSGMWVYSFSQKELTHLKMQIVGMSKEKAQAFLESEPGIQQVSVSLHRLDLRDQLPNDPKNLHIVFIVVS